jgi:hypothetical protein
MAAPKKDAKTGTARVAISPVNDGRYHSVYFIYTPGKATSETPAGISGVKFNAE